MNDVLSTLIRTVPNLDIPCIEKGVSFFESHQEKALPVQFRQKCLKRFPELRYSNVTGTSDLSKLALRLKLLPRESFTEEVWSSINHFTAWCMGQFPTESYIVRKRISTSEEVCIKNKLNGPRAWFDIVGFQIVPRSVEEFMRVVRVLSGQKEWKELFVFNTFPFTQSDFTQFIGPNSSSYYRSIHYHFNLGRVCVEVQVRFPITDQWSMLHHATCYKPILPVTLQQKNTVLEFGRIANWVDFYQLSLTK